jgi:hypothetical protein
MSRFYGTVRGERGEGTRRGHGQICTNAASWSGAIQVFMYADEHDVERFYVKQVPWQGVGMSRLICTGLVNGPIELNRELIVARSLFDVLEPLT